MGLSGPLTLSSGSPRICNFTEKACLRLARFRSSRLPTQTEAGSAFSILATIGLEFNKRRRGSGLVSVLLRMNHNEIRQLKQGWQMGGLMRKRLAQLESLVQLVQCYLSRFSHMGGKGGRQCSLRCLLQLIPD